MIGAQSVVGSMLGEAGDYGNYQVEKRMEITVGSGCEFRRSAAPYCRGPNRYQYDLRPILGKPPTYPRYPVPYWCKEFRTIL